MAAPALLIIEDDLEIAQFYYDELLESGYTSEILNDFKNVNEYLEESEIDLIIIDYRLPGITGDTIIKNLKKNIPVIMVSGDPDALENRNYPTMEKPISINNLISEIRKILKIKISS